MGLRRREPPVRPEHLRDPLLRKGETLENQHRKITGYRELDTDDIAVMNHIKEKEQEVLAMLDGLNTASSYDKRWVAIARTQMELGFMSAVRAVARPTPGHPAPDGLSEHSIG